MKRFLALLLMLSMFISLSVSASASLYTAGKSPHDLLAEFSNNAVFTDLPIRLKNGTNSVKVYQYPEEGALFGTTLSAEELSNCEVQYLGYIYDSVNILTNHHHKKYYYRIFGDGLSNTYLKAQVGFVEADSVEQFYDPLPDNCLELYDYNTDDGLCFTHTYRLAGRLYIEKVLKINKVTAQIIDLKTNEIVDDTYTNFSSSLNGKSWYDLDTNFKLSSGLDFSRLDNNTTYLLRIFLETTDPHHYSPEVETDQFPNPSIGSLQNINKMYAQEFKVDDDSIASLQYNYSEADGTLSITGFGHMPYYFDQNGTDLRPWKGYLNSIKHIVISDSVTSISNSAFRGCTALQSVSFGNRLKSIGELAFRDCSALERIYIPDSVDQIKVTDIYEGPFFNCTDLKEISVGGIETITSGMFRTGSQKLEKLTIRGTVKTIGGSAFDSVVSYRSGSGWIGTNGYDYTPSHSTALIIEEGVETIMWYAFNYCKMFTSITIPESVKDIQTHAFTNCIRVSELIVPENATKVEDAFAGVPGLKVYPYSSGLASVRADNLPYSVIPYNYTMIFPAALYEIGTEAFGETACEVMVFPDTLNHIHARAFEGCKPRVCVFNNGDTIIDEGAFGSTKNLRFACDPTSQVALWAKAHGIPVTDCLNGS